MTVAVVEYGIGNIQSVVNACRRAGAEPEIVADGAALRRCDPSHIVLPGVGAVGRALSALRERDLAPALEDLVIAGGRPFLGICVGMQVLGEVCEEFGRFEGLGWIPGNVRRIAAEGSGLRVPHVGWNTILPARPDPLLDALSDSHFYFLHSYTLDCPEEHVLARAEYGDRLVCAVRRDNVAAVQFHPEKSSRAGTELLGAFFDR